MIDSSTISHLFLVDALEVLSAPKRDIDCIKLSISCHVPRILNVELDPDVIDVIAEDVPVKANLLAELLIIRDD